MSNKQKYVNGVQKYRLGGNKLNNMIGGKTNHAYLADWSWKLCIVSWNPICMFLNKLTILEEIIAYLHFFDSTNLYVHFTLISLWTEESDMCL